MIRAPGMPIELAPCSTLLRRTNRNRPKGEDRRRKHTFQEGPQARLAQSAERKALNLVVVGSSPTVGVIIHGS